MHAVFGESQIFRIDHFLGKEGVQNTLALRFVNGLFEPAWDTQPFLVVGTAAFYASYLAGRGNFGLSFAHRRRSINCSPLGVAQRPEQDD